MLREIFARLRRDEIMLLRQAEILARLVHELRPGFAVRLRRAGDFRNALPDQGLRDDHLRLAVVALLRLVQRAQKRGHVVAVDFLHVESVGLIAFAGVLALRRVRHRVERDRVRVVDQDQVIEPEVSGERARFRGDAFLQTTVAGEADDVLIENLVLGRVEARRRHLRRHRDADGVGHALAERTGGAFDAGRFKKLRMARRLAVQLPEALDLLHRQIVAAQVQPGVKEHAAVAGREDEVVAADPARFVRIVLEGVTVKHRAHLRAAQRQTEVAGFRGLHRVHAQARAPRFAARERISRFKLMRTGIIARICGNQAESGNDGNSICLWRIEVAKLE